MIDHPDVWMYGRASTRKQEESPETQKDLARKYASLNNLGEIIGYFIDPATSGKIPVAERTAGRELIGRLKRGDHVIVSKLDRMFRKLSDCVIVLEKFERMGVNLHVCNLLGGAIDLGSPMGRFLIHILAAFAELERAFISERTKEGLARRKRQNLAHSRFPGYGFKYEKRYNPEEKKYMKVRVSDPDERAVMRKIVQWRIQENPYTWDEIREHLNYNLKLKTKDGKEWDLNRIRRACKAELMLQLREQRAAR